MKLERNGNLRHCGIAGACEISEHRALPDAVSDDPVGMAAALIEIRKPFVVALALGQADRTGDSAGDIAVFTTNGSLLAGRLDDTLAAGHLARAAADCFARRCASVIEFRKDEQAIGASATGDTVLRFYMEPVSWK